MSREYCDYIVEMLTPLRGVSARAMFGGFGIYRNGLMFAIIFNDTLYFKVTPLNRQDFEDAGAQPFEYQAKGKRVSLSYWSAPAEVLDDEDTLVAWADKACRAARENKDAKTKRPVTKRPKAKTAARKKSTKSGR